MDDSLGIAVRIAEGWQRTQRLSVRLAAQLAARKHGVD
jgi:hypothetical protein